MKYICATIHRESNQCYLQFFMTRILAEMQMEKEIAELKERNHDGWEVAVMKVLSIKKIKI